MMRCKYLIFLWLLVLASCGKESQNSCFDAPVIESLTPVDDPESFIDGEHNGVPFRLENASESMDHYVVISSVSNSDVNGENLVNGGRKANFVFYGKNKHDDSNLNLTLMTDLSRDSLLSTNAVMNSLMEELDRKRKWGVGRWKHDNEKMAFSYSNDCYGVATWDGFPESQQYVHVQTYERTEDHDQYHYHIVFKFDVRVYVGNANYEKSHFKGEWNAKFSLDK